MSSEPVVAFIFAKEAKPGSARFDGFAKKLAAQGGLKNVQTLTCALENLIFVFNEDKSADVIDSLTGRSLSEVSFAYFKSWESMPEEAAALANFFIGRGVQFVDGLVAGMGVSKIATMARLWRDGIRMPNSVYARRSDQLEKYLRLKSDWSNSSRFILKDINGEKGKHNYLVNLEEAISVLNKEPERHFVCQRFIPNDGDYRIGIYGSKPKFALHRKGDGSSHLNNTSAGGKATYIPIDELLPIIKQISENAADAVNLQIAGVDVIVDSETNEAYVLEVNQGSQIVTGKFIEENVAAFNEEFEQLISNRSHNQSLPTIGRLAVIAIDSLKIEAIQAKIDTGAYRSSIHVDKIELLNEGEVDEALKFAILPSKNVRTANNQMVEYSTKVFTKTIVKNSSGHKEPRFVVDMKVTINGLSFEAPFTLSNREQMKYPLLIGRKTLRNRFIVDVDKCQDIEQ